MISHIFFEKKNRHCTFCHTPIASVSKTHALKCGSSGTSPSSEATRDIQASKAMQISEGFRDEDDLRKWIENMEKWWKNVYF